MTNVQVPLLTVFVLFFASVVKSQDEGVDKKKCIQDLLEWCKGNTYPTEDNGVSMMSMSYYDSGHSARIFCSSNFEGTQCMKNSSPWFKCNSDKTMTYKGEPLTEDSEADDDICSTRDKALEFGSQGTLKNTEFIKEMNKQMQRFQDEMKNFWKQMGQLPQLFRGGFPFNHGGKDDKDDDDESDDDDEKNEAESENF